MDAGGGNARRELYHYGARAYLPGVWLFTQPDTIVPDSKNPQAFNRYAYTLNNPMRFVDPSGRCSVSSGEIKGDDDLDCTWWDFHDAPLEMRLKWVRALQRQYRTQGWFNIIEGVIQYIIDSPTLKSNEYISLVDAVDLWAIQEGLARHLGASSLGGVWDNRLYDSVSHWHAFFAALLETSPAVASVGDARLKSLWGAAEQAAINYGVAVADWAAANGVARVRPLTGTENQVVRAFVFTGKMYRDGLQANVGPYMVGVGNEAGYRAHILLHNDPRQDGPSAYYLAMNLEELIT